MNHRLNVAAALDRTWTSCVAIDRPRIYELATKRRKSFCEFSAFCGYFFVVPDSVTGVRQTLAKRLLADEEAQSEFVVINVGLKNGIELLAAEPADDLPFVVRIQYAFVAVARHLGAFLSVEIHERGLCDQVQFFIIA